MKQSCVRKRGKDLRTDRILGSRITNCEFQDKWNHDQVETKSPGPTLDTFS